VESPSAPQSPGREESTATIEIARKEFDAVKSLRDFGADAKSGLPRLTMPSMPVGGTPADPSASPAGLKRPELVRPPSKNWLVEAMEKRPDEKDPRSDDERVLEKGREPGESRSARTRGSEDDERKNRPEAPNPFARFLGEWMTPQDLALLKPALDSSTRADSPALNGALPPGTGDTAFGWSEGNTKLAGIAPTPGTRLQTANPVRENPYLDFLGGNRPLVAPSPAITPSSSSPASALSLPGAVPPAAVAPPPARPGQLPDFVRPNTDEKYFKQLKRF
jgi:hypothetical protein